MLSTDTINLLCTEENFVQDFLRYHAVHEQRRRLSCAIDTIRELTPPGRLETAVDLSGADESANRLRKIEDAHAAMLESLYGATRHSDEQISAVLSAIGRL